MNTKSGTIVPVVKGYGNLPSTYCAIHTDASGSCTLLFPERIQFYGCDFLKFMGIAGSSTTTCTHGVRSMETSIVMQNDASTAHFHTAKPGVKICITYTEQYKPIPVYFKCLEKQTVLKWFEHFYTTKHPPSSS